MPLTDVSVRNAKAGESPLGLFDGQGLYLLAKPQGGNHWRLKYRFAGKEKLLSFGSFPDVTLKEARQRRDKARQQAGTTAAPREPQREPLGQGRAPTRERVQPRPAGHATGPKSRGESHNASCGSAVPALRV
jgi:hypothetical protein